MRLYALKRMKGGKAMDLYGTPNLRHGDASRTE
jgi:hypothetical protein